MGRSRSRSRSRERHHSSSSRRSDSRDRDRDRDRDRKRARSRSRSRSRDRDRDRRRDEGRDRERERGSRSGRDERDYSGRRPPLAPSTSSSSLRDRDRDRDGDRGRERQQHAEPSPRGSGSRDERGREASAAAGESGKGQGAGKAASAAERDDEEDEEPLELDEASMALLMGGSQTAEEEQRLIEERKRKRAEIEALHRRKQEEEGKALAAMEAAANGGGGDAAATPSKRPRGEEKEGAGKGKGKGKAHESDDSEEEEEDEEEEGPVEVRVHNKPLREDEEMALPESAAAEAATVAAAASAEGNPGDDALRNGQREPDEEPEFLLDMFALDASKPAAAALLGASAAGGAAAKSSAGRDAMADALEDNWDDPEGYYKTLVGEVIAGRYLVLGSIGRGVFSSVLKCQDKQEDDRPVAIKVIRNNEVMRKAAQRELDLLREISAADPENKKHCVRLLDHFEHRNHVVLVFESLQMNLRETLRKFGKHVGINITAVRTYAKQLLVALRHIGNLSIVHADIKPDNILVSQGFAQLKLCDFGSAFKENAPDNDPTPYLVSRFYRAPEIILGFEYDRAVDLWSIGCCLYELFTGRVAFPGANNNEMLRLMMEVKGGVPQRLVRRHRAAYERLQLEPLFEADGRFRQLETDPVTKKPSMRLVHVTKPARELQSVLMKAKAASDDRVMVQHLADLLERIFTLDPSKRISVKEALHHPFVSASAAQAALER